MEEGSPTPMPLAAVMVTTGGGSAASVALTRLIGTSMRSPTVTSSGSFGSA